MKQFVPVEKRSKKQQKEYYDSKRRTWDDYGINPVTRSVPSGKTYNRNKQKNIDNEETYDLEL